MSKSAISSLLLCGLVLSGCATPSATTAPSGNAEHPYDGWWTAKLQKAPSQQFYGNWILSCQDLSGEFAFEVVDSVVQMTLLGNEGEQPLSKRGSFRLVIETGYAFTAAPNSDTDMRDGSVSLIVKGNLRSKKPRGTLIEHVKQIKGGCHTPIVFEHEDAANESDS